MLTRTKQNEGHDFLTPAQVGAMLGLTERTLYEKRRDGSGIPYIRLTGNRILYRRDEVDRWLAARTFKHTAAEAAGLSAA